MPPIRLDHIPIARLRVADAPPALAAVRGPIPGRSRPSA
jgi:hypothetical protein